MHADRLNVNLSAAFHFCNVPTVRHTLVGFTLCRLQSPTLFSASNIIAIPTLSGKFQYFPSFNHRYLFNQSSLMRLPFTEVFSHSALVTKFLAYNMHYHNKYPKPCLQIEKKNNPQVLYFKLHKLESWTHNLCKQTTHNHLQQCLIQNFSLYRQPSTKN